MLCVVVLFAVQRGPVAPSPAAGLSDVMPLALLDDALVVLPLLAVLRVVACLAQVDAALAFPLPPVMAPQDLSALRAAPQHTALCVSSMVLGIKGLRIM